MSKAAGISDSSKHEVGEIKLTEEMEQKLGEALYLIREGYESEAEVEIEKRKNLPEPERKIGNELRAAEIILLEDGFYEGEIDGSLGVQNKVGSQRYKGDSLISFLFEDLSEASSYLSSLEEGSESKALYRELREIYDRSKVL